MDVSLDMWLGEYMEAVQVQFGPRVWFIGLQGSFGRGEATAESDLDVVLILDAVSAADLWAYSAMLDRLPERERVCGFVSGKGELLAWEPADLFQFCHDTRPLLGTLDQVLEKITEGDVHRAVWTGACNAYHMCAHNMVHEKSLENLFRHTQGVQIHREVQLHTVVGVNIPTVGVQTHGFLLHSSKNASTRPQRHRISPASF